MRSAGLERVLRDLRIFRIFEGTNDILRLFVGLTGLQTTGDKLKAFSQALKNPFSPKNFNTLLEETSSRLKGKLFSPGPEPQVHPSLQKSWALIEESTNDFYDLCERSVIKHKKEIVEQQLLVKYIANSAMELFAMAAVVARASRANDEGSPTAAHETLLAETYCELAHYNISQFIKRAHKHSKTDGKVLRIAELSYEHDGHLSLHPTGI